MPFLINEDQALYYKLKGLTYKTGSGEEREVPVRFNMPDSDYASMTYPLIVAERLRAVRAPEREWRGYVQLRYAPECYEPWEDYEDPHKSPFYAWNPIPYRIDYQITVFSRRKMDIAQMAGKLSKRDWLPVRWGYLVIPEDHTVRSMDVEGPEFHDGWDENRKPLFQAVFLARVTSEIIYEIMEAVPVEKIVHNLYDHHQDSGDTYIESVEYPPEPQPTE
ncbi:hypothetical protein [Streptomyces sp. NBC_00470]|uniref:hypothetical protein n=1 Tax=Streptomyces sp. NBC_00470 TaxID=2975753 RepID=UPI0032452AE1